MKLQTKLTASIGLIVFLSISGIFLAIAQRTENQIYHELKNSASILFEQLILTRNWIADHPGGGVYVQKDKNYVPNPYLEGLGVETEVTTTDGRRLALRNPALVVRELSEYAGKFGLFRFHMTSLNLLNPFNKPDEFEVAALKQFEGKEVSEIYRKETVDGKKYFRYMAPLYITENCLQCHAQQGYHLGEVRGGLSVFIPMDQANREITNNRWILFISGLLVIVFVELILYVLINRIVLNPISTLTKATKMIRAGNYDVHLQKKSEDEIGELTDRFREMKETILARTKKQQESEEKYRALSETAMDAIVTADASGKITMFNKAAERMFLFPRDEIIGREITLLMPDSAAERHRAAFKRYVDTRAGNIVGKSAEFIGKRKNGEEFPLEISVSAYEIGGDLYFSAITRDITEKKRMEANFLQAEKLSSIGGLVAGVAHELNNPLTGIMGYSELILENEDLDPQVKKDLEKIHLEAERSAKIVKNLLTFSREHKHEKNITCVTTVVESTLNLVRHQVELKGFRLLEEFAPDLPPIFGDAHQLQQAFLNIINNAVDALEEKKTVDGFLKITVARRGDSIQVVLLNNGPRIPEEKIKSIFDPFFTTKDVGKGTGLGLSIVFGTIQDHHGTVEAKNVEPEGGVAFIIELPVAKN